MVRASAPVIGEKVVDVSVVGVDEAGVDESTEKTIGGHSDPDVAAVIFDTTGKAGWSGWASGLCGSTLNLKIGIAITDAVKVASDTKGGKTEPCADWYVNSRPAAGKVLPSFE